MGMGCVIGIGLVEGMWCIRVLYGYGVCKRNSIIQIIGLVEGMWCIRVLYGYGVCKRNSIIQINCCVAWK